jgi:hypothetical protein
LPASLLRHRPGPTIAGSLDVLILVPEGHPDLLERLRRIARAFRDRGRRVALRRVYSPAVSAPAISVPRGQRGKAHRDAGEGRRVTAGKEISG